METRLYYLLSNWLAFLYGRIQSPRPDVFGRALRGPRALDLPV